MCVGRVECVAALRLHSMCGGGRGREAAGGAHVCTWWGWVPFPPPCHCRGWRLPLCLSLRLPACLPASNKDAAACLGRNSAPCQLASYGPAGGPRPPF